MLADLRRILIVLHGVECVRSKQWIVEFFQTKLRTQLKSIAAKQNYYPFVYSTRVIRYNIDNLINGGPTATLLNAGRRAFYALCGGLYLFQGIRELAVMRLDFAAMEAGVQKMRQAYSGLLDSKVPGLQEIVHAASESEATHDFSHIMKWYKKHEHPSFIDGILPEKRKIVKFALVSHLTLFAIESSTSDLSDNAFQLLSDLAVSDDSTQWRADSDIYERLLDALASVGAKRGTLRQDCLQLLEQMENSSIQNQQTVKDWRGNYNIHQKLDMTCKHELRNPSPSLYDSVRKQLGLNVTHARSLAHKQELIEHYKADKFAKVSLLLDDGKKRHIADFDFHIVVYESVDVKNEATNDTNSAVADQMLHNLERTQRVQTAIQLQEIFARRRQLPSKPEEEVNRVLLLGNPGTGKTSLSKRLCNNWASCNWGSKFNQVYLLPIRQLTRDRLQLERTLEASIAVLLFNASRKSEDERNALHHQIKDKLDEKTTLLVLDGLDEATNNIIAEEIVIDALSRSCSILVLTRPHNLGEVPSQMDIQIECLGLSDEQLEGYVHREVPDTSKELIQFLKKSLLVWETAKTPINAQIMCTLWTSDEGKVTRELKSVNLKSIYSWMTDYAWQRFEEKKEQSVDRQSLFSSLETIAFKAITQGKVEIPRTLVMKYSQGTTTRKLLLDSGFLLFREEGQVFEFAHLSFQEFFAGRFLAKNLRGSEKEGDRAKQYIADRKYYDTARVTMSFMTQCYCQEEDDDKEEYCVGSLKQLLSILDENPVEVVGFQHILLKMRTIDAFLSVCGNCAELIRSDDDLHEVVQSAMKALEGWVKGPWLSNSGSYDKIDEDLRYRVMEDLERMSNLFSCLPEFLSPLLRCPSMNAYGVRTLIAKPVTHAPEQLLQVVPKELRGNDSVDDGYNIGLEAWFILFANSGPDCAVLALEQLKTACQDQREKIRKVAYIATVDFLQVLPEREDLQFLCREAMKDTSSDVRYSVVQRLSSIKFKSNSEAANLAWILAIEAMEDEDEGVREEALCAVGYHNQTSEEIIEKKVELLLHHIHSASFKDSCKTNAAILFAIGDLLKQCPTKLTLFLPYFGGCCEDQDEDIRDAMTGVIGDLTRHLPIPQKRELGEMISRVYGEVEDPGMRHELVEALYEIGEKIPEFRDDCPDVVLEALKDSNNKLRGEAEEKRRKRVYPSVDCVNAINEVFWDQSLRVKKELLLQIQREGLLNAETVKLVGEMATNYFESDDYEIDHKIYWLIFILTEFQFRLSSKALHHMICFGRSRHISWVVEFVQEQPLDIMLKYFWDTTDQNVVAYITRRSLLASLTYHTTRGGKSIVSIVEKGKKIQQEAPTELLEKLITLLKLELRKLCGDFLP